MEILLLTSKVTAKMKRKNPHAKCLAQRAYVLVPFPFLLFSGGFLLIASRKSVLKHLWCNKTACLNYNWSLSIGEVLFLLKFSGFFFFQITSISFSLKFSICSEFELLTKDPRKQSSGKSWSGIKVGTLWRRILKLQPIFAPDNGIPMEVYKDVHKIRKTQLSCDRTSYRIGEVNLTFPPTPRIGDVSGPSLSMKLTLQENAMGFPQAARNDISSQRMKVTFDF